MTREERELSIEYLEKIKENYIEGDGYERHPLPEYYAIESAIKSLEQEPKWTPVTEKLPEELIGVLVYCPTRNNIFCAFLENGKWYIFSPLGTEKLDEVVIAWQPLPESYKESEGV